MSTVFLVTEGYESAFVAVCASRQGAESLVQAEIDSARADHFEAWGDDEEIEFRPPFFDIEEVSLRA